MRTGIFLSAFLVAGLLFAISCGQEVRPLISGVDMSSHRPGSDCLSCHRAGGEAASVFPLAGTLYDADQVTPYRGGVLEFYTGPNGGGELIARLETDSSGNFYTSEAVAFGTGLYVKAISRKGSSRFKVTATTIGNCNSCHGKMTEPVWVE